MLLNRLHTPTAEDWCPEEERAEGQAPGPAPKLYFVRLFQWRVVRVPEEDLYFIYKFLISKIKPTITRK